MPTTIEQPDFEALRDVLVAPGPNFGAQQIKLVKSSLKPDTDRAGRDIVFDYIDTEINDKDPKQAALAVLADSIQSGVVKMDEQMGMNHEQYTFFQDRLAKLPTGQRNIQARDFQDKVEADRNAKKANNSERLEEFLEVADFLADQAKQPMERDTALLAYKAVEAMQDKVFSTEYYFNGNVRPEEVEIPGIELTEGLETQLQEYARALLNRVPPEYLADAYRQQALFATLRPDMQKEFLQKSLRWVKFADANPVSSSLKTAALAERMGIETVWHEALKAAIHFAGTVREKPVPTSAKVPSSKFYPIQQPPKPSRKAGRIHPLFGALAVPPTVPRHSFSVWEHPAVAVSPNNPDFVHSRASLVEFGKEHAYSLLEDTKGCDFLHEILELMPARQEKEKFWSTLAKQMVDEVIVEDTAYAKTYSPAKLADFNRLWSWPRLEGLAPPQILSPYKKRLQAFVTTAKPKQ